MLSRSLAPCQSYPSGQTYTTLSHEAKDSSPNTAVVGCGVDVECCFGKTGKGMAGFIQAGKDVFDYARRPSPNSKVKNVVELFGGLNGLFHSVSDVKHCNFSIAGPVCRAV
eukprot:jgi/Botrbrau1/16520/Bobra.0336s0003.1